MSETINEITNDVMDLFLANTANLLACLKNTEEEIFRKTAAAASINPEARDEISLYAALVGQPGHAGKVAREDLKQAVYRNICKAFLTCFKNGTISQAIRLTDLADEEMLEVKYAAGVEQRPPKAPAAPVKSAQEQFDDMIRDDWNTLPYDKIKAKKAASTQYRKRLAELLDSGAIASQVTALHDAGREIR